MRSHVGVCGLRVHSTCAMLKFCHFVRRFQNVWQNVKHSAVKLISFWIQQLCIQCDYFQLIARCRVLSNIFADKMYTKFNIASSANLLEASHRATHCWCVNFLNEYGYLYRFYFNMKNDHVLYYTTELKLIHIN